MNCNIPQLCRGNLYAESKCEGVKKHSGHLSDKLKSSEAAGSREVRKTAHKRLED